MYKRRSYRPKKTARRYKRRSYKSVVPRPMKSGTRLFHVKQRLDGSSLLLASRTITQTFVGQNFGFEFRAGDLPQWSSFAAIFDFYRINKIVFSLIPMSTVNSNTTVNPGVIATVLDYDNGSTTLSALTDYEQYPNCKISPCVRTKTHTRSFVPHINIGSVSTGGSVVGATNKPKQWIDCAQPAISHHGLKLWVDAYGSAGTAQTFQVICTYYMSFKNVR